MPLKQTLFRFDGRLGRLPYYAYSFLAGLLGVVVMLVGTILGILLDGSIASPAASGAIAMIAVLPGFALYVWMLAAVTIKRLHDLNRTGWHFLWMAILACAGGSLIGVAPALGLAAVGVGFLAVLWLLFTPGDPTANAYGPPPGVLVLDDPVPAAA